MFWALFMYIIVVSLNCSYNLKITLRQFSYTSKKCCANKKGTTF